MKSFSQYRNGVRGRRRQISTAYRVATCPASSFHGYSTFSPEAGQMAFFASRNRVALTGAFTGLLTGGILFYVVGRREALDRTEHAKPQNLVSPESFTFRLKTSRGTLECTQPYPGDSAAEKLLHDNETSRNFEIATSNGVVRFDNNWVASNHPVEDRHVESYLSRSILCTTSAERATESSLELTNQMDVSSLKLFSVIDGHAGYATADVLAKDLHPRVIKSLQSLYVGNRPSTVDSMQVMRQLQRGEYRSFLRNYFELEEASKGQFTRTNASVPVSNRTVSDALMSAYMGLDLDICSGPLRLIANTKTEAKTKADVKSISEPATNGACALTVMVDEARQEVYVANTGDSRAVAGYYVEPQTDSDGIYHQGGWRCEVLTEDHTANGPKELKRLQKEHPREAEHMLSATGRILGGLMPARAFGDSPYYKWTKEETEAIGKLNWSSKRRRPALFDASKHRSPPYVTARPDVTFKSLKGNKHSGQLKFIILATDGLWAHITSEEAVGLVTTYLAHPEHAPVERKTVQDGLIAQRNESADKYPGGRKKGEELTGNWVYKDRNAATHLIRNAFEACKWLPDVGKHLITAQPPISRRLRDDVTCSVIFFDNKDGEILSESKNKKANELGSVF